MTEENMNQPVETEAEETEAKEAVSEEAAMQQTDKLADLEEQLRQCQAKADEYLDGWQRARAELLNYKKRTEREQSQVYQTVAGNILKRYLEIMDDLELALKNRPEEGEGAAWADGIELIARKLMAILESEGVTPMSPDGAPFDPNLHEAVTHEESDEHESGQIIGVIKQGYMLGDRVLRPALVRVAR